jgi:hypothetical protein
MFSMFRFAAVPLLLLTAACAGATPESPVPQPEIAATQPAASYPAAEPAAPSPPLVAPAVPPLAAPPVPVTLDLNALETQLRATKAIGTFTKISLKNNVDDLLKEFREYYRGKSTLTMTELWRSYDLLLMKVLSLLQDDDQKLASAIVSSRGAIWALLADPETFTAL